MKTKFLLIAILLLFNTFFIKAQNTWSLEKCIMYALENNIQIKQQKLNAEYSQNTLQQSRMEYLPSVNASASRSFDRGLTTDYQTNINSKQNQTTDYYTLTSNLNLFNGLRTYNTTKKNDFAFRASLEDVKKIQNNISLNIATAYLMILYNQELLEINRLQTELTKQQVERTQKLVEAGSVPKGNLLLVQAQLANEEMAVIDAENSVRSSTLNLTQLLDLQESKDFQIEKPQIADINPLETFPSIDDIFGKAQGLPEIKSAEYTLKSTEKSLSIAKSGRSPQLSLGFSYNTGYNLKLKDEISLNKQFNDNLRSSLTLRLSIPIFNSWQVETQVANARISIENQKYTLDLTKNSLYKEIQQSYNDALSAQKKYIGTKKAYEANKESFAYTQQKFEVGMVTTIEYNDAKTKLTKTESEMLQTKYEYVFKKAVLDFYQGNPIKLN